MMTTKSQLIADAESKRIEYIVPDEPQYA